MHCLGVFLTRSDEIRAHCWRRREGEEGGQLSFELYFQKDGGMILTFFPYLEIAALRISSSVFLLKKRAEGGR